MEASGLHATWALVLAGGDGTRLRELTTVIAGTPIPKQYCRIAGDRSLLESTLDRIAPLIPAERTAVIANRDHLQLAEAQLGSVPVANLLVQPRNRDTGPGILLGLLALERRQPGACVAMFPSDHYVADDRAFHRSVMQAAVVVQTFPEKIVLLGIPPDHAAPGLGYVEPAQPLPMEGAISAYQVAKFREKPGQALARRILRRGGLWNSFVLLFRISRLLELVARVRPDDWRRMLAIGPAAEDLESAYHSLEPWNFSSDFLARIPSELAVLRADDMGWSDWGTPQEIERTFARLNRTPPWHAAAAGVTGFAIPARATA
jgi:mannose-1-phosphate guanylyltransferase